MKPERVQNGSGNEPKLSLLGVLKSSKMIYAIMFSFEMAPEGAAERRVVGRGPRGGWPCETSPEQGCHEVDGPSP